MNKAQEFIRDKVKNWNEKRFGSGGELIVHYDEIEKWLEEYAEQKVKNLVQPDVSGSLPDDQILIGTFKYDFEKGTETYIPNPNLKGNDR